MESASEKWQNHPHNHPDIKKCLLIDKEVPGDSNVIKKETERF